MKITLNANGTLSETTDAIISTPGPNRTACEIVSLDSMGQPWRVHHGTHDKAGAFTMRMDFVTVSGIFDDEKITGTGSGSDGSVGATYSFTLPGASCGARKIPLPNGIQVFTLAPSASPKLGLAPAAINPLGVGAVALPSDSANGNIDKRASFRVSFCPFEQPVDILLGYATMTTVYALNSDGRAVSPNLEDPERWRRNVKGSFAETVSPDFGGLLAQPGRLPLRGNTFFVIVVPSNSTGLGNGYIWIINDVDIDCGANNKVPLPEGQEVFLYDPVALPVPGVVPSEIKPLAIGPAALGGDTIHLQADGCFRHDIDVHFGILCASNPASMFFLQDLEDPRIRTKDDLLQELAPSGETTVELPAPVYQGERLDLPESDPSQFYLGSASKLPTETCYYAMGVTPHNVRDKFYLWAVPLNRNITESLKDFWWEKRQQ